MSNKVKKMTNEAKYSNLGRSEKIVLSHRELYCTDISVFSSLDGEEQDYTLKEMLTKEGGKYMAIERLTAYLNFYEASNITESEETEDVELIAKEMTSSVSPFLLEMTVTHAILARDFIEQYLGSGCKSDFYSVEYNGFVAVIYVNGDKLTISYGMSESCCRAIEAHQMQVSKIEQHGV